MLYTVYKITNKQNGKFYIGCHKTKNPQDNYMGSGTVIKRAVTKYGEDNFIKDILFVFPSPQEMFEKEKELIAELNPPYNLHEGGLGGWDYINENSLRARYEDWPEKSKLSQAKAASKVGKSFPKEHFVKISLKGKEAIKNKFPDGIWKGRKHKECSKKLIGKANSKHQAGSGNSMYGTMWITNGVDSLRIMRYDTIPTGYRKGRVIKKQG